MFISSTTKTMLGARHYWKFMKWTLFFGSLFTTILIVSERKLYERKSRAFLQLHGYSNNRKQNSYFCSLPDKNWIVDFFEGMWQILLTTYKLLSVAWSWLGDLHCSFYFWWERHRHLSLLQKMVKNDKLAEERFLLREQSCVSSGHPVEPLCPENILDSESETGQKPIHGAVGAHF